MIIKNQEYEIIPIGKAQDIRGQKFGFLTVLDRVKKGDKGTFWACQCECGELTVVSASHLKTGHTISCGCMQKIGRFEDISGQRFGRLEVISYDFSDDKGHTYWKCKCNCGNIKTIRKDGLLNNSVISCGCAQIEHIRKEGQKKLKNLTGQKFGRLTAQYLTDQHYGGYRVWHCICDCGNEKDVASAHLLRGVVQSCGCFQKENRIIQGKKNIKDLTNQKFGRLTALYPLEDRNTQGHVIWHCICECGNECNIRGSHLTDNSTQSCGCITTSIGETNIQKILEQNNIKFEKEKIFNDLNSKENRFFRYDFYLPEYNRLIEFDGIQHFEYTDSGWNTKENFEKTQQSDKIKNNYAKDHNIPLVRIPYWERDNITLEMLLEDNFLIEGD